MAWRENAWDYYQKLAFNQLYINGIFPEPWKRTLIAVTPKPGKDLTQLSSYSPISLLSHLAKAYEGVFLSQLETESERLKILPNFQFGFRNQHSTVQQLLRLADFCPEHAKYIQPTVIASLDIEAGFDKVPSWCPPVQTEKILLLPSWSQKHQKLSTP